MLQLIDVFLKETWYFAKTCFKIVLGENGLETVCSNLNCWVMETRGKRTKCYAVISSKTKFKTKGGRGGNEQLFNVVFFRALYVYCLNLLCFTWLTVETINILRTITLMQLSCYSDTIPLLGEEEFCTWAGGSTSWNQDFQEKYQNLRYADDTTIWQKVKKN